MKKFTIMALIIILTLGTAFSKESTTDTLTKIENSILGTSYSDQKPEPRLGRLEKLVYGKTKNGKTQDRLNELAKDLNADVIGQETTPSSDTFLTEEDEITDSSVDYPVVDDIEKKLNIKTSATKSLHSRLVTIEKQLFNNVYDTDDFYTRVERIKGKVYKGTNIIAQTDEDDYASYENDNGFDLDKILKGRYSGNINSKLTKLERKVFDTTYSNQNTPDRLTRLEREIFNTEFYDDDESERLERLEGAVKGQRTAGRYDNNKFQQRLNTALQIGTMILMVLACIL